MEAQDRLWADTSTFLSHLLPSLLHFSREETAATEVLFHLEEKGLEQGWSLDPGSVNMHIFPDIRDG